MESWRGPFRETNIERKSSGDTSLLTGTAEIRVHLVVNEV